MLGTLEEPITLLAWLYFYITIAGIIFVVGGFIIYVMLLVVAYRDQRKTQKVQDLIKRYSK